MEEPAVLYSWGMAKGFLFDTFSCQIYTRKLAISCQEAIAWNHFFYHLGFHARNGLRSRVVPIYGYAQSHLDMAAYLHAYICTQKQKKNSTSIWIYIHTLACMCLPPIRHSEPRQRPSQFDFLRRTCIRRWNLIWQLFSCYYSCLWLWIYVFLWLLMCWCFLANVNWCGPLGCQCKTARHKRHLPRHLLTSMHCTVVINSSWK